MTARSASAAVELAIAVLRRLHGSNESDEQARLVAISALSRLIRAEEPNTNQPKMF